MLGTENDSIVSYTTNVTFQGYSTESILTAGRAMVCLRVIGNRESDLPLLSPLRASFFRLFRSRFPVFVSLPSFRKLSLAAAAMPGWTRANRQRGEEYQKGLPAGGWTQGPWESERNLPRILRTSCLHRRQGADQEFHFIF